ncbi:MAG: tRNA epoxyqueuosine(34) reductase QueG [Bacteroidia bacterium]
MSASNTEIVKRIAVNLGFSYCGIARAAPLDDEARKLEQWLKQGQHGEMAYMERHFDMRIDPRKLVPGARSVISLLYNYFPVTTQPADAEVKISKYAYGRDYHKVIRKKLKQFLLQLRQQIGDVHGRGFVDSAPVMDKAWAQRAGTGWLGKHTNLINKQQGSFFFIANLITDLELQPDPPVRDYCGTCTRCIDACPTDAITPYSVDANRCISYLTIELKDRIPDHFKDKMEDWAFGCDICQDVCPWNRFSKPHQEPDFKMKPEIAAWNIKEWEEMTEHIFDKAFEGSPIKRTKFSGMKRNISFLKKQ